MVASAALDCELWSRGRAAGPVRGTRRNPVQCLPQHPWWAVQHRRYRLPTGSTIGRPAGRLSGCLQQRDLRHHLRSIQSEPRLHPGRQHYYPGPLFHPRHHGWDPAEVSGFGAVFTDVDLANSTEIEFFDRNGNPLTSRSVLPGTVADASLSFLGVTFNAGEMIASIRITTGTNPLAQGINDNPTAGIDLVVMDDFLYAEPVAAVPEPASWALLSGAALALMGIRRWRRRGQQSDENLPVLRHA